MRKALESKALAVLAVLALVMGLGLPAQADISTLYNSGNVTQQSPNVFDSVNFNQLNGQTTCTVYVSGTWTGTLAFQGDTVPYPDNSSWFSLSGTPTGGGASVTSTTANGSWFVPCPSLQQFQVIATTMVSGTASVGLVASAGASGSGGGGTAIANPLPVTCTTAASCPVNNQQVSGVNIDPWVGFSGEPLSQTGSGNCYGRTATGGIVTTSTPIVPSLLNGGVTLTPSTTTQVVALTAGQFINVCQVTISGAVTTPGLISFVSGAGVNCASTPNTVWSIYFTGAPITIGNGFHRLFATALGGNALCITSGAFVATAGPFLYITYAKF